MKRRGIALMFFVLLCLNLVSARDVVNIHLRNQDYIIKVNQIVEWKPLDKAFISVNGDVFEIFQSQKRQINGLSLVPKTIYADYNKSFVNFSFHFEEELTFDNPEISFKVDNEDYTIKLIEVSEKFPFDEGIIEIGEMPIKIIQSQKKTVKRLSITPLKIKEEGNSSYVDLSVSFSRNLDYKYRIVDDDSEDLDVNESVQEEEEEQEKKSGGFIFYLFFLILVIVFIVVIVYIFLKNKV
ncbi:hypothetical protein GF386_06670 [Candidatus Pacearchaeota archaeon]|nr:hypothetical protein [Candidatus Pacearchaeota archaeon]MBD3283776.1 hypothetical protein [Candidatus Pacearchaeota archaeon]